MTCTLPVADMILFLNVLISSYLSYSHCQESAELWDYYRPSPAAPKHSAPSQWPCISQIKAKFFHRHALPMLFQPITITSVVVTGTTTSGVLLHLPNVGIECLACDSHGSMSPPPQKIIQALEYLACDSHECVPPPRRGLLQAFCKHSVNVFSKRNGNFFLRYWSLVTEGWKNYYSKDSQFTVSNSTVVLFK